MTVTIDSPFKAAPRISEDKFVAVLESVGSFAVDALWGTGPQEARCDSARRIWEQIVEQGHDPAVWLAILGKESSFGTNRNSVLWRNNTHSWTNARSVRHPDIKERSQVIRDSGRGSDYVRYQSVYDSVLDGLYRVDEPGFAYRKANAVSIVDHIRIWAPGSDDNKPEQYAQTMCEWINQWMATDPQKPQPPKEEPPMPDKPIKVAIAAGHHNADGGGASGEQARTGPLTRAIADELREHGGFDVHVITPDNGMGTFPGGLQDVARAAAGLNPDLWLEVHFEGTGSPNIRGCFAIYPDADGDVDTDVRDTLGPDMARRVSEATGVPLRGGGVMSERNTGVGGRGHRLGAFSATASVKATCTRLIFEYGALTSPADRALIDSPDFKGKAARATVAALAGFYGVEGKPREPQQDAPADARVFPETGKHIMLGFRDYWEQFNDDAISIQVFGYPLTNEQPWKTPDGKDGAVQYFERAVFEWHPGTGVLLRRLGAEALEAA